MSSLIYACILATGLFYVKEPVVDMRKDPSNESRVVSQAVFAERVQVEEERPGWAYIRVPEGYSGWVQATSVVHRTNPYNPSVQTSRLVAFVYGKKDTEYGPILTLPYGSSVEVVDEVDPRWIKIMLPDEREGFIQRGDVCPEPTLSKKEDLVQFSRKFLGLPYRWGGRTSLGYDCSGFVQMLYNQIGVPLPRNSKRQIKDPQFQTVDIEKLEPGDLIFFGKSDTKITHVGMYIGNGQFIHSTVRENKPWIHVSQLSDRDWNGQADAANPYREARQLIIRPLS
jgi:hypothetical protein